MESARQKRQHIFFIPGGLLVACGIPVLDAVVIVQ
jgi:hypothetical protein